MINFQYLIIRYRHDFTTGEFINVGLVFFIPPDKYLEVRVTNKTKRISDFYSGVSGTFIRSSLKSIEKKIKAYARKLEKTLDFSNHNRLDVILSDLYPKDEGAIQFSPLYTGISRATDFDKIFSELYNKLVDKYTHHYERASRTDEDAKKFIYHEYFNKLNITPKLKAKEVKTKNDSFKFAGIKNGKWNYYKPISFDLLDVDSIKDKVYKWVGIKSELFTSDESFALYFLSLNPRTITDDKIRGFIKKQLEHRKNGQEIYVIEEEEIPSFAKSISEDLLSE